MTEKSGSKSHPVTNGEAVVWVIIATFAIGTGMAGYALHRVLHYLAILLMIVGVVAVVLGFAAWQLYLWQRRREAAMQQAATARVAAAGTRQQPIMQQPRQEIQPGSVTHNYGHTLALPAEWTTEQIRAFRGE